MSASAVAPIREAKILVTRPQPDHRRHPLPSPPARLRAAPAPSNVQAPAEQPAAALNEAQRDALLMEHLPQVEFIARRIHERIPPQVLLEDLVHAGIVGLIDAVRKYNPAKNVHLRHYAEFRIRGAILDSLRQVDWSPRALRRQARRMEQAVLDCKARLGRDPSEPEIASELNISLPKLQTLLGDLRGLDIGSLQVDATDSNSEEEIQIPATAELDPYHQTLRSERTALLEKGIGELSARQRQVLALYHFKELTMKQIGAKLGIGESRVSQIHTAALTRLRTQLHSFLEMKPSSADRAETPSRAIRPGRRAADAALWQRSF